MDKDIADFAVAYAEKQGARYAEARLEESSATSFVLKNGVLDASGFDQEAGLGLRIIANKSLGFASTNTLTKERVKALVDRAIATTKRAAMIGEEMRLAEDTAHQESYEVKQKIKLQDLGPEDRLSILFEAEKAIAATNLSVPARYLSLSDTLATEYLVNSEGSAITATVPRMSFFYLLTIAHQQRTAQRMWQYGQSGGFELVKQWDIPRIMAEEVTQMHKNLEHGVAPPKGAVDVVAAPQVVGIMVHESVGHPSEADRIIGREAAQAGESFITKEMLGTRIGSDAVTVVDDPTIENSYGYFRYDNEGVKARQKFLIKQGIITEFLHNRRTAAEMGVASNGSSRAIRFDRESIVRMSNTVMLPGDHTEEELIEDVKLGVYMKNFMEWNIDDKRFNQKYTGAEAYLIKNGRIAEPVLRPTLEITTPKLYSSVDAVAKNTEYHAGNCGKGEPMQAIPVWFGGPSLRIRKVRVS